MIKRIQKTFSVLLACLTVVCTSAVSVSVSAEGITHQTTQELTLSLDNTPLTLQIGSTYTFPAIISNLFPDVKYQITVGNNTVVSAKGDTITANGAGTAVLTVILPDGQKFSKDIVVSMPAVDFKFDTAKLAIDEGQVKNLKEILSEVGQKITWSSSRTAVASISADGILKAKSNGHTTITAALANGQTATCDVTVRCAPKTVSFSNNKLTLGLGESTKVDCTVNGRKNTYNLTYASSDPKTAEIDSKTGVITTHKTGKVVLSAVTENGKKASCTLYVKQAPSTITFDRSSVTVKEGESVKLNAILPSGTSSGSVTYYVNNDKIVNIDRTGLVKALKTGSSRVYAETYNGKIAVCRITVTK